ncbi:MAG: DUF1549 domain-containing protein, partial [Planctomycetes bacterium]|nr:DUF1549 domain-containing protein [Planctomycetota bacterium]
MPVVPAHDCAGRWTSGTGKERPGKKGLAPSPQADRGTLIRRLYFDLIGLPPTPQEVDAFLADTDPKAYEKLVDRLLESPHYGERWARHWLDVVHYGDTHGYDKDKPRANAWPYRDYVIRALNADKPYWRFVQEQIAGDVLFPGTVDGIEALGFIAAGPWDFIGHVELPETKIDGKIARHLDRDDMVTNTIQTFGSLTIQCAQCHDHKFDPITQEDYYSLQAVFAALDRADKDYFDDAAVAEQFTRLKTRQRSLAETKKSLEARIPQLGGKELEELDKQIVAASKPAEPRPEFGYHSAIEPSPDRTKWVQVDLGQSRVIDRIVIAGCHDDFNNIGAGFGFPARFKIEIADDSKFQSGTTVVADYTQSDFPNPGIAPLTVQVGGKSAHFVRVTATKLALRKDDYIFALAELEVYDPGGMSVARDAQVTSLDSIEAPVRWSKNNLVDGYFPGRAANGGALAVLRERRQALLDRVVDKATRSELEFATQELANVEVGLKKLPQPKLVYAGTVHYGAGSFLGTGPNGGKPRVIHVLNRGNVLKPVQEVGPGAVHAITGLPARFELPPDHAEGDRRAALARWLTDPRNPLTWRSFVNRIWQYHFGRGIVETPNDFGRMGAPPTHPALLDWLAVEFRDGGQSLKTLHKLMLTSATYRQASHGTGGNRG